MQAREAICTMGASVDLAERWLWIRGRKSQALPDGAALETLRAEAWKVGLRFEQAIECCTTNGWAWFKAHWYADLPTEKKLSGVHGPPKASTGGGGVGLDGGALRNVMAEESPEVYRERRQKMLSEIAEFKARTNAKNVESVSN